MMPRIESPTTERVKRGGVVFHRALGFSSDKAVLHAFSTRIGGVSRGSFATLNLGRNTPDEGFCVEGNLDLFTRALGIRPRQVVRVEQVHGTEVLEATHSGTGVEEMAVRADGLITRQRGVALLIQTADCLPVMFHDPVNRAIGIAHAGWRGTVGHVAVKTLLEMGEKYGTKPADVRSALGPCIGVCCYEVGDEVMREFSTVFPWAQDVFRTGFGGKWMLDLAEANARQLLDVGVREQNISRTGLCTVGNIREFYSHRVEATQGGSTGRMASVIMLR
jgi:polyphenol oxidase